MSYKILLFDLDDTLLDFGANEIDSLNKLFLQHGYTSTNELFRIYHSVNKQLWSEYENGNIDIKGSLLSGIDTCWINRKSQKYSAEIQSTYTITSLEELCDICDPNRDVCWTS